MRLRIHHRLRDPARQGRGRNAIEVLARERRSPPLRGRGGRRAVRPHRRRVGLRPTRPRCRNERDRTSPVEPVRESNGVRPGLQPAEASRPKWESPPEEESPSRNGLEESIGLLIPRVSLATAPTMSGDSDGIHLGFSRNGVFAVEVEFGPATRPHATVGPTAPASLAARIAGFPVAMVSHPLGLRLRTERAEAGFRALEHPPSIRPNGGENVQDHHDPE